MIRAWRGPPSPIRSPRPHAARAERSSAALEHLRNDGAREAHATVSGLGLLDALELVERRDVGPETSNQWLLRYRVRAGEAVPRDAR